MTVKDWRDAAACRGMDTALFFPRGRSGKGGGPPVVSDEVRRLCSTCPVRRECREHADAHGEQGVWAGVYRVGAGA